MDTQTLLDSLTIMRPELILAGGCVLVLMLGVFAGDKSAPVIAWLAVGVLIAACAYAASPLTVYGDAFKGFTQDSFSSFAKIVIALAAAASVILAQGFLATEKIDRPEYYALVLFASLGMYLMVSATDLMTLYVGVELQSLSLYVMAAYARDDGRASEAGLKYFVLGALSSGLLLFGASLVYGFAGTTTFEGIARAAENGGVGLLFGLVLMASGIAFKASAAPFHMWTPDVYEGAPTASTAFFAAAPKVAAIALFARFLFEAFGPMEDQWRQVVVAIAVLSMIVGAFGALVQTNIKRLLAYSSIGNIGYALIALAAGPEHGAWSLMFYMAIYAATTLGLFAGVLLMRRAGAAVENINDLAGLSKSRPGLAIALTALLFSVAGVPPLAGFFAKYFVFLAGVQSGLLYLALFGAVMSVVSAYYYLKLIKIMWFDPERQSFDRTQPWAGAAAGFAAFLVLAGIAALGFVEAAAKAAATAF